MNFKNVLDSIWALFICGIIYVQEVYFTCDKIMKNIMTIYYLKTILITIEHLARGAVIFVSKKGVILNIL